jgi:hypothetical protein
VVGVEAAQEVLGRLAAARVLHHHEPGRDAEDVLHAANGPQLEVTIGHRERGRGAEGALAEDHRRGDGVDHRRRALGRRRHGRQPELVREADRRRDGDPAPPRRLEGEPPRRLGRGLVEAMAGGCGEPDTDDAARGVEVHLEAHGALDALRERIGRVRRLGVLLQRRRRQRLERRRGRRGRPLCASRSTQPKGEREEGDGAGGGA